MSQTLPPIQTGRIAANGLEFDYDYAGSGDTIALCLHGFPESRFSWRAQLPVLAARGFLAVAPDLRGYAHSSRPANVADYALPHLIADAAAIFEAFGAKRRILIAHDWGAIIAWQFAIEHALPLDALIIMNVPHPGVARAVTARPSRQWLRSLYTLFFQIPWLPEKLLGLFHARAIGDAFRHMAVDKSAFPDAIINHYRTNAMIPGALTAMLNYYRANLRDILRPQNTPIIDVPTLMIWGEEDSALGIELTEGYGPFVRDFTLNLLPGVSHWVQQEAPLAVNACISNWLDKHWQEESSFSEEKEAKRLL